MSLQNKFMRIANAMRTGASIPQPLSLDDMAMLLTTRKMHTVPGVNLLQGSDPTNRELNNNSIDEYNMTLASGGNGKGSLIDLDPKQFKAKHGFRISGNTGGGNRDFNQRPVFYDGSKYTVSIWARITPGTTSNKGHCYIRSWSAKQNKELTSNLGFIPTNTWRKYTFTFDTSSWYQDETASFAFGVNGLMNADFAEPMLEVGETAHNWQLSPYDKLDGGGVSSLTAIFPQFKSLFKEVA